MTPEKIEKKFEEMRERETNAFAAGFVLGGIFIGFLVYAVLEMI